MERYERTSAGVLVRSEARAWLAAAGLDSVAGAFARAGETRGPTKSLLRVPGDESLGGGTVYVKRYDFNRFTVPLRGALKLNPPVLSGPRELENLLALAAAGLRVPLPLAAGDEDSGARRRSFVALAPLAGAPLAELPAPADPAARRRLLADLAALLRALHGAGFWHRDLYACNVFVAPGLPLGLLDCERVGRRAGLPRRRWRLKDLAALDYSLPWPSERERLRALRRYLGGEGPLRAWARAVRRKAERLARHGQKGPRERS
ncbi:MAG: lipopolysaccharide kinase InaA family protein [Planctomycetota bacterium]